MPAPNPALVVKNPPPLNANTRRWPFSVLPFPAGWLLGAAGLSRGVQPREKEMNDPLRVED